MLRITATSKGKIDEILVADYFDGNFWNHQVTLRRNLDLPSVPEQAVFADCPPLATNEPQLAFIYSDVLLRAASLGSNFDSALALYGNTGNNIFVANLGAFSKHWGYKLEAQKDTSKLRFFDFLQFPFEVTVQKFQPTVIAVTSSRLYTSNLFDVAIFSAMMQIAGAAAYSFDYYMNQVFGNTGNPVVVRSFGNSVPIC